ncbi:MAG: ABC transporter permease [Chloroflexi bacterium CFX4]|nr:ABC transporter permease [Chloroflexi bacterium CFX4]MDL1923674.1 ABC transporter permease [Chloroflexi bacterium CFX3]
MTTTAPPRRFRLTDLAAGQDLLTAVAVPIVAVLGALSVGAVFLILVGADPLRVYEKLIDGALGNTYSQTQTIGKATPLLLVAIGVCIAFRANVLNIGVEGQVIIGGLATTAFTLGFPSLPSWALITGGLLAGFAAGILYGAIPGALKAYFGVNEILSTIMMNQIAIQILILLLTGPMRDVSASATSANIIQTAQIPREGWLPLLMPRTFFHTGALLALALAVVGFIFLWGTVLGYRIRAVGANPDAARYAGVPVRRMMFLAMALSGGLAGLAGGVEVLGVTHRTIQDFSTGYGFSGIVVALFGSLHPIGAIPASLIFGGLLVSGTKLQSVGVSAAMVVVLQGLIVLFVVSSAEITRRRRRAHAAQSAAGSEAAPTAESSAAEAAS